MRYRTREGLHRPITYPFGVVADALLRYTDLQSGPPGNAGADSRSRPTSVKLCGVVKSPGYQWMRWAFYDALLTICLSARAVMSDSDLRTIACEVARVRAKATIGHNARAFALTCVERCGGSWRSSGILRTRKSQQRNS